MRICTGVNWERDLRRAATASDLRNVVAGDPSPTGADGCKIARGIEVRAHLPARHASTATAMNATVLDERARGVALLMGCYGIGVTRIVAAAIEQNHDERGIIWPEPIAPFNVVARADQPAEVRSACARPPTRSTRELSAAGIEVLLRRPRRAPGRQVRGRRAARHPASSSGARSRPESGRHANIAAGATANERVFALDDAVGLHLLQPDSQSALSCAAAILLGVAR